MRMRMRTICVGRCRVSLNFLRIRALNESKKQQIMVTVLDIEVVPLERLLDVTQRGAMGGGIAAFPGQAWFDGKTKGPGELLCIERGEWVAPGNGLHVGDEGGDGRPLLWLGQPTKLPVGVLADVYEVTNGEKVNCPLKGADVGLKALNAKVFALDCVGQRGGMQS